MPEQLLPERKCADGTAKVFMADGFLRTGDVAVMDEKGFIRIVDRKKDMMLRRALRDDTVLH